MKTTPERAEELALDAERSGYPEHAKLHRANGDNDVIGGFLEWLGEQGIELTQWDEEENSYFVIHDRIEVTIGKYLGIDPAALEREKRGMLDEIRKRTDHEG